MGTAVAAAKTPSSMCDGFIPGETSDDVGDDSEGWADSGATDSDAGLPAESAKTPAHFGPALERTRFAVNESLRLSFGREALNAYDTIIKHYAWWSIGKKISEEESFFIPVSPAPDDGPSTSKRSVYELFITHRLELDDDPTLMALRNLEGGPTPKRALKFFAEHAPVFPAVDPRLASSSEAALFVSGTMSACNVVSNKRFYATDRPATGEGR
jgi:hypothetical protein